MSSSLSLPRLKSGAHVLLMRMHSLILNFSPGMTLHSIQVIHAGEEQVEEEEEEEIRTIPNGGLTSSQGLLNFFCLGLGMKRNRTTTLTRI